jgi:hypothetical protein
MRSSAVWQVVTDVSEEYTASITLKMEMVLSSKTLATIYQTI